MVLGDCLLNVFTVYLIKKRRVLGKFLVSCIPQNEMVVFAGDMNGRIGSSYVGYDRHMVVLGMALGTLMVPGYWSLQMG